MLQFHYSFNQFQEVAWEITVLGKKHLPNNCLLSFFHLHFIILLTGFISYNEINQKCDEIFCLHFYDEIQQKYDFPLYLIST